MDSRTSLENSQPKPASKVAQTRSKSALRAFDTASISTLGKPQSPTESLTPLVFRSASAAKKLIHFIRSASKHVSAA